MSTELARVRSNVAASSKSDRTTPPAIVERAGNAALFAWDEVFKGEIPNPDTRKAYVHAVRCFLAWCEDRGTDLVNITPGMVGEYFAQHPHGPATKKQHLSAIRKLFDKLVIRHVIVMNPALSVRTERYQVIEGKTPEIGVERARALLRSIDDSSVVCLRDRAIIATMIYTAARVGALSKLNLKHLNYDSTQWTFRFNEKNGKSREIPLRHDLEGPVLAYREAAGLTNEPKDSPFFRGAVGRTKTLSKNRMSAIDMCRMVKRRLRDVGLALELSPHSFRVTTLTNLLEQGVPIEEVQYLAGHSDSRITSLYDRRPKRVTRNIVERISI